jgi:hypothetical protein
MLMQEDIEPILPTVNVFVHTQNNHFQIPKEPLSMALSGNMSLRLIGIGQNVALTPPNGLIFLKGGVVKVFDKELSFI